MLTLRSGSTTLGVDEKVGGKMTSLVAAGEERILQRPDDADPAVEVLLWGCFFMVPWVGRLDGGKLPWEGEVHQFPRNFGGHAIHGLGFDKPWTVDASDDRSATLSLDLRSVGWPFGGTARHALSLAADGASLSLVAEVEAAERSMPVSAGWHPYFRRPDVGDLAIEVTSANVLATRDDLIPTGELEPVAGDTDLRDRPILGDRRLDHVYANVEPPNFVQWPDLVMTQDFSKEIATVVVYTPEGAACCEPQSAWPDAPSLEARGVNGTGVAHVAAGETFRTETTWSWQPV